MIGVGGQPTARGPKHPRTPSGALRQWALVPGSAGQLRELQAASISEFMVRGWSLHTHRQHTPPFKEVERRAAGVWLTTERRRGENNLSASYSASAGRAARPTCGGCTHLPRPGALPGVRASPEGKSCMSLPRAGVRDTSIAQLKWKAEERLQFRCFREPRPG